MRLIVCLFLFLCSTSLWGNELCDNIFRQSQKLSDIKSEVRLYEKLNKSNKELWSLALDKNIDLWTKLKTINDAFVNKTLLLFSSLNQSYHVRKYLQYVEVYLLDQGWNDFMRLRDDGSFYLDFYESSKKKFPNNPMGNYIRRLIKKTPVTQINFTADNNKYLGFYNKENKYITLTHESAIDEFILNHSKQSNLLETLNHEFRHAFYYTIVKSHLTSLSLELRSFDAKKIPIKGYESFLSLQEIYTYAKDAQASLGVQKITEAQESLNKAMEVLSIFQKDELKIQHVDRLVAQEKLDAFQSENFLEDVAFVIRPTLYNHNKISNIEKTNKILLRLKKLAERCSSLWKEYCITKNPNTMRQIIQTINTSLEDELKETL